MTHQPYPKYRASGIQWLGEVPEHWEVKRLKTSVTYRVSSVDKLFKENELPVKLCNYTDVYYNDFITKDMSFMEATATPEEIHRFSLRVHDIVITKDSEDWRDIAVPAYIESTAPDIVCGYHLAIISPNLNQLDGKYLLRCFQSNLINQQFQVMAGGVTRFGLPKSAIGNAIFPIPPKEEQTAIADFLDRETGRIDTLVAKNKKLIELLKEERSALISRTVTRGLPKDAAIEYGFEPHTRFKESGVEWLGEVPEDWAVVSLRHLFKIKAGGDLKEEFYNEEKTTKYPYPIYTNSIKSDDAYGFSSKPFFKSNTITVTGRGEIGYATYRDHAFDAIIRLLVLTPQNNAPCKYFAYFINSMLVFFGGSTAVSQLSTEQISPYKVFSPSLPEQQIIADFLDRETAKIDKLIEKIQMLVTRLQEYRIAIITDAVTGKIDVREMAA